MLIFPPTEPFIETVFFGIIQDLGAIFYTISTAWPLWPRKLPDRRMGLGIDLLIIFDISLFNDFFGGMIKCFYSRFLDIGLRHR